VGSLVFNTSGGAKVPRRVRFPSASAKNEAVAVAGLTFPELHLALALSGSD